MENFILFISIYFIVVSSASILVGRAQNRIKESIEEINFDLVFISICYIIYHLIYFVDF